MKEVRLESKFHNSLAGVLSIISLSSGVMDKGWEGSESRVPLCIMSVHVVPLCFSALVP